MSPRREREKPLGVVYGVGCHVVVCLREKEAMGETGECSMYTVIWQCFGICLFVFLYLYEQIELPRVCLFVVQITDLQIDGHVELFV
jgi:hypothetical protein